MKWLVGLALASAVMLSCAQASAGGHYDTGASGTEIKIGNFMPYSGPASAYGIIGKVEAAYFNKVNDEGGIGGRKIRFISYDDAYSPPKAVEQTRRLVESDEVLLIFGAMGTPSNSAVRKYLNSRGVPQLFPVSGASKWNDPAHFPWTMGFVPSYASEGKIYASYILDKMPAARIAVLYQDDDFGKDFLRGLKERLGAKARQMVVAEESYEVSDPTVDSRIVMLKDSGATVFLNVATPKFAAQAIRRIGELRWHPVQFLSYVSASVAGVLAAAGLEYAQGIISASYAKDATDPQWRDDDGMKAFDAFVDHYLPDASKSDGLIMTGYNHAQIMEYVLRHCGDDLTRAHIMKVASTIKDVQLGGVLPGIRVNTSPTDFAPIKQLQLMKFVGDRWERFGEIRDGR